MTEPSSVLCDPFGTFPAELQGAVVSIGNFDGLHRGHARLLAMLRDRAAHEGAKAVVLSFEPHPLAVLRPEQAPQPLFWPERKIALLKAAGADDVMLLETSPRLLQLTASEFFETVLLEKLKVRGLVEGPNFGFGRHRQGNLAHLQVLCAKTGVALDVVPLLETEGSAVSSSRLRGLIVAGEVALARRLMGRPHRIRGTVIHGAHRGRALGIPTANLAEIPVVTPAHGVYAARVLLEGTAYVAACNLGPNPTFGEPATKVEVHLLDFEGDLYGTTLEVEFLARLRPVKPFASLDALKRQIEDDLAQVRRLAHEEAGGNGRVHDELERTIEEWLALRVPALLEGKANGGRVSAALDAAGRLTVHWHGWNAALPTDALTVLHFLGEEVRKVFPRVQSVESTTD